MKQSLTIALLGAALLASAHAATAYWTGGWETVRTVSGLYVKRCEYRLHDRLFYTLARGECPHSIEVE